MADIAGRRREMFEQLFWDKWYSDYERRNSGWFWHYVW